MKRKINCKSTGFDRYKMFAVDSTPTTEYNDAYFLHVDSTDAIEDLEDMAGGYDLFYDDKPGWYMWDEHKRKYVRVDDDLVQVLQRNPDLK